MSVVIGNAVALIAALLMVYVGVLKSKKSILIVQTIDLGLFVVSNIILKGFTGAIISFFSAVRNILCYKNKLNLLAKWALTLVMIGMPALIGDLTLMSLLPVSAAILYLWCMNTQDVVKFKGLIVVTLIAWLFYDLYILSYTSALFDFISVAANIVAIIQIKK